MSLTADSTSVLRQRGAPGHSVEPRTDNIVALKLPREADQQDGELVATQPGDRVGAPDMLGEQLGGLAQRVVADEVAVPVVDRLEVVEIADHQHAVRSAATGRRDGALELGEEAAAIEQPGELVGD